MKGRGIEVKEKFPGVYYFYNIDIAIQLLVTDQLMDEEAEYLKLLQFEHKSISILSRWIYEYIDNIKDPLYSVIMDVLTKSNPNEILEVYKSMGIANLNEDNRAFLMDAVKKLEIDKKFREEGKEEGKLEGKIEGKIEAKLETAKAALKKGLSRDVIIDITGLDEKQIEELEKEISQN